MSEIKFKQKLIIGLGNPDKRYKDTWHNIGFMFIDLLKEKLENDYQYSIINKKIYELTTFPTLELKLLKPLTYMNNSGLVVSDFLKYNKYKTSEILIVHDDLDIEFSKYKIQQSKFPKAHNGINSIQEKTGKKSFYYLRIGIETREGEQKNVPGEKYVLSKIPESDKYKLELKLKEIINSILINL